MRGRARAVLPLLCLMLASCASSGLKPPEELTPIGDISFYSLRLGQAVETLQKVVADGEAAGAINTDDARTIMSATKVASIAGKDLEKALAAGADGATAKAKAIAVFREALENLPPRLNDNTRALVEPYVQTILTLLAFFA